MITGMKFSRHALALALLVSTTPVLARETQAPTFANAVSTADPRATAAGLAMIRQGGNAMDAIAAGPGGLLAQHQRR